MEKKKDRSRDKSKSGGRAGGKKMFIDNEDELALREREIEEHRAARNKRRGEDGGTAATNAESEEEEQHEEEGADSVFTFDRAPAEQPKKEGAAAEEGEEDSNVRSQVRNPNHMKKQTDPSDPSQMNRREREALAAAKAKEEYQKRHMAGETEQAQKELARLAIVRARREAAKQKREAEGRPPGWTANGVNDDSSSGSDDDDEEDKPAKAPAAAIAPAPVSAVAAKKKAAAAAVEEPETAADGGPPKLKAMDIKKMSGDQLKEHLKARNLDIQGQKKDLMKRLSDYEAARP